MHICLQPLFYDILLAVNNLQNRQIEPVTVVIYDEIKRIRLSRRKEAGKFPIAKQWLTRLFKFSTIPPEETISEPFMVSMHDAIEALHEDNYITRHYHDRDDPEIQTQYGRTTTHTLTPKGRAVVTQCVDNEFMIA